MKNITKKDLLKKELIIIIRFITEIMLKDDLNIKDTDFETCLKIKQLLNQLDFNTEGSIYF